MVTGGAGFIGSHLTEALVRRGETVRVLDNLSTGRAENLSEALPSGRVELIVGDVQDVDLLSRAMTGCDRVFHLAASVGVGVVTAHPLESMQNNVEGVQSLFGAVHRQPVAPKLIVFSSSEVYGKSVVVPLHEDTDFEIGPTEVFRWSYAAAKILSEYFALCEHARHGIEAVVVRCFNTSGPRQLPTYGMVIPRFFEQAIAGQPLTVYGDGRQTRCFSYVGDVVEGVIRLSDTAAAVGQVFNVGSDVETSVLDLARMIRQLTGSESEIRLTPYQEGFGSSFQESRRRVPELDEAGNAVTGFRQDELPSCWTSRTPTTGAIAPGESHEAAAPSGNGHPTAVTSSLSAPPAAPRSS
ncbi:MAG: NAD-dependent epimerase/dehydratase family protein [Candidatus Eisenbacteria bacterium]